MKQPVVGIIAAVSARGAWAALALLPGVMGTMKASRANAQEVRQDLWGVTPYAAANAVAVSGNTLYVGGNFISASPVVGCGAAVDPVTATIRSGWPRVAGYINVCVADGTGGVFIGGRFSGVGGLPRRNLAHIFSTGIVDPWAPDPDGDVFAILAHGSIVYIGGEFNWIGGEQRSYLVACERSTGRVTPWNPEPSDGVHTILRWRDTVYFGGFFRMVGGIIRNNLAAVDANTGSVTSWDPEADFGVWALGLYGDTLFVAGEFYQISGTVRPQLAAFDLESGALASWNVPVERINNFNRDIPLWTRALLVDGDRLYVAGSFNRVGGAFRPALAAIDIKLAQVSTWDPRINRPDPVTVPEAFALTKVGNKLFVSGAFDSIGGQPGGAVCALDATTGERVPWNPQPNEFVASIAALGNSVYLGGSFTALGPSVPRHGLAAFDLTTGAVTSWDPYPDGQPYSIAVRQGKVYVGGHFRQIGGEIRQGVAEIDSASGRATSWNPTCDGFVRSVALGESTVYVGGWFAEAGGAPRSNVAELSLLTGQATGWDPNPDDQITTLLRHGSRLYAGGWFTSIGSAARGFLAELDPLTGRATAWNPKAGNVVVCLAAEDTTLYVSSYLRPDGVAQNGVWTVGTESGAQGTFHLDTSDNVECLTIRYGVVYAGGDFTVADGLPRGYIAAADARSGELLPWDLSADAPVDGMTSNESRLFPVGAFLRLGVNSASLMASASLAERSNATQPPNHVSVFKAFTAGSPCRAESVLRFSLASNAAVSLALFDAQGRIVSKPMRQAALESGDHVVAVDVHDVRSGCYVFRLTAGEDVAARKVVVIR